MDEMIIQRKKPILLISPLPPPHGGIATWTQTMIHLGLPDGSSINHIDTKLQGRRNVFDRPRFSIVEAKRTLCILSLLIYHLIFKKPRLIHINSSLSVMGIFRDWLCGKIISFFKVPFVVHYHGNMQDFQGHRFKGLSLMTLKSLMKKAAMNIVTDQFSLKKAQTIRSANSCFLPNFIEDDIFEYPTKTTQRKKVRAIFVGGITRQKGCKEIYQVASLLPDIDFYLFGKIHDDMMNLYRKRPPNLVLGGEVQHKQLLTEMQNSDFLIFPSFTEGFPLTVLEAMSLGKPVIATSVGAIPQMIIEGKGGILVSPGDLPALVDAVKQFSGNPLFRKKAGDFNKQFSFENYRYSVVIRALLNIYDHILNGGLQCVE